jgi:hypothetical protein
MSSPRSINSFAVCVPIKPAPVMRTRIEAAYFTFKVRY